jgi:hypothetical protein
MPLVAMQSGEALRGLTLEERGTRNEERAAFLAPRSSFLVPRSAAAAPAFSDVLVAGRDRFHAFAVVAPPDPPPFRGTACGAVQ